MQPRVPPWKLPQLVAPLDHFGGDDRLVLVVDANLVLQDLWARVRGVPVSLLELAPALGVRIVMSADDVRGARLERRALDVAKKRPEVHGEMVRMWHDELRPHLYILDPIGFEDTPAVAQVRTPERDPDDANLLLLAHVIGANGFLTYDQKAFELLDVAGQWLTVLRQDAPKGMPRHGEILAAFAGERRVRQALTLLAAPAVIGGAGLIHTVQHVAHVSRLPGWAVAILAVGAAFMAWRVPGVRAAFGPLLSGWWSLVESIVPDPDVLRQMHEAQAHVAFPLEGTDEPMVRAARFLAHDPRTVTTTALVRAMSDSGCDVPAPTVFAHALRARPGVFAEVSRGRRDLTRDSTEMPNISHLK